MPGFRAYLNKIRGVGRADKFVIQVHEGAVNIASREALPAVPIQQQWMLL